MIVNETLYIQPHIIQDNTPTRSQFRNRPAYPLIMLIYHIQSDNIYIFYSFLRTAQWFQLVGFIFLSWHPVRQIILYIFVKLVVGLPIYLITVWAGPYYNTMIFQVTMQPLFSSFFHLSWEWKLFNLCWASKVHFYDQSMKWETVIWL